AYLHRVKRPIKNGISKSWTSGWEAQILSSPEIIEGFWAQDYMSQMYIRLYLMKWSPANLKKCCIFRREATTAIPEWCCITTICGFLIILHTKENHPST